ncbi:MAG: PilZ domain-containing protein [Desulfocapsaceae bacterium]|nr:PilZ domain-containing protein [Desulfocapsaceae bacterium]
MMEKRKCPRVAMKSLCVDVSDGVGFSSGNIANFSRAGFCMTDLTKKMNGQVQIMTVVVSGHRKNFKMHVTPRWSTKGGQTLSVGAQIVNIPMGWIEFVISFEPPLPDNLLGGARFIR